MKHVTRALCLAAAFAVASFAWAQAPSADKPVGSTTAKEAKSITVTGCLREASDEANLFVLTADAEASGKVGTSKETTVAKGHKMYRLVGSAGEDLKKHLGHKVQVAGTVNKDAKPAEHTAPMGSEKTLTAAEAKSAIELNVTSFKHISETCPAK